MGIFNFMLRKIEQGKGSARFASVSEARKT